MRDNTPEKPGYNAGILSPDQRPQAAGPVRGDLNSPKHYEYFTGSHDKGIHADDECNFDHNLANRLPLDGMGSTAWGAVLEHGVSVDNVQQSAVNFKASLKDS